MEEGIRFWVLGIECWVAGNVSAKEYTFFARIMASFHILFPERVPFFKK